MAIYTAFDMVGKKEDISDAITNISPTDTPFQSMIGSQNVWNITYQWQEDSLIAPAANAQIEGFTALTPVANPTVMRSNISQILSKTAQVSGRPPLSRPTVATTSWPISCSCAPRS
jgi:hypothetical protein